MRFGLFWCILQYKLVSNSRMCYCYSHCLLSSSWKVDFWWNPVKCGVRYWCFVSFRSYTSLALNERGCLRKEIIDWSFFKWHETVALSLLFGVFSHTRKKRCGQFPIELLRKRGLTNMSIFQLSKTQSSFTCKEKKNTSSVYRESPLSVFSIQHLSLRTQITATYRAWFIIHKGLFRNSWDCNCNDKVVQYSKRTVMLSNFTFLQIMN